jgi:Flp pilus assembly protein TadG
MRASRRGQTAVVVALSSVVLFSTAALAVDLGYARVVDQELQNGADAAAHGGAYSLDGTAAGMAGARGLAVQVGGDNIAATEPIALDPNEANAADGDVVLGYWDHREGTFTPRTDDPYYVNAVSVHAERPALQTFFAHIFGRRSVAVGAKAISVREFGGASAVDCFLPLAIPDCLIGYHGGVADLTDVQIALAPAGVDSVGWARPNGIPNASWSRGQILSCEQGGSAMIGDPVGLQNGVVSSAMNALVDAISASSTSWRTSTWGAQPPALPDSDIPAASYGKTFEGVMMVFDGGPEYCSGSGGSYTGTETITGFMWGAVYDVARPGNGNGGGTVGTMRLRLDTLDDYQFGTQGSGPEWGITADEPPRMVATY